MSGWDILGMPAWNQSAAEDLAGTVAALRCAIGEVRHSLAQVEAAAGAHWTGPNRKVFDLRCAEIRRLFELLDGELGVAGALLGEGIDSLHEIRRSLLLLADAAMTGDVARAAVQRW